jgi:hypothetical protein
MNNTMRPLQANADQLAKYGRYGDSMLVHMNPAEVQGIASLSPTGRLTTNPVTGQPEAFLPFLAPLIAQFVPGALSAVGLGGLGAAAAGAPALTSAITSGLITGAVEGDLEKGIMAGITSFGMGKALGAASDAVGAKDQLADLATANTEVADASAAIADAAAMTQPVETLTPQMERAGALTNAAVGRPDIGRMQQALSSAEARKGVAQASLDTARQNMTGTDRIGSLFTKEGAKAGLEAFMKPESILPTAIGAGNLAQMDAMERQQAIGRDQEAKRQRRRDMDRGVLSGAAQLAQPNNPFAGVFNKPGLRAFGG